MKYYDKYGKEVKFTTTSKINNPGCFGNIYKVAEDDNICLKEIKDVDLSTLTIFDSIPTVISEDIFNYFRDFNLGELRPKPYENIIVSAGAGSGKTAVLTERIKNITEHCKTHAKDFSSRRGLLMLVARRKRLLAYLKKKSMERYLKLIEKLGLKDNK